MGSVLECARCGATLRVETARHGYVACEYCGAQTAIRSPASGSDSSSADATGTSGPAGAAGSSDAADLVEFGLTETTPTPTPIPSPSGPSGTEAGRRSRRSVGGGDGDEHVVPSPAARARRAVMGIGSSLLTLAAVVGGIYYAVRGFSFTHNPSRRTPVEPRVLVARGHAVCPLRVNSDPVVDFGLLMKVIESDGETFHQVRFIDGRTGKLLGNSDPLGKLHKVRVVCLGPRHVGIQGPDHELRIFSARKPHAGPKVKLRDKLQRVAATERCARLRTADGSTVGISLPKGKAASCEAKPLQKLRRRPGMPTFRKQRTFSVGKNRFRITARRRGTPVLTVTAHQGGKRLWKRELDITATRYGIPAILTERTLLVVGALHPRRKRARLIGLDRATGERRFTVRLQGSSIATFGCALMDNGALAVLWSNAGVAAFDPASGKEAWRLQ